MTTEYANFLACKRVRHIETGFDPPESWANKYMKPFQADTWRLSCRRGRNANWLNIGLGKSLCQLAWADACVRHTNKKALILTPLAVAHQFGKEAEKFGINDVKVCREGREVRPGITVTNYDRMHKFDLSQFDIVAADEAACMAGMTTVTAKTMLMDFRNARYKLPATAVPAPNDQMELGIYAEFCGAMSASEMLSMFFVHDGSDTSKWRLRGHAPKKFYEFLASFAVVMRKPGDLGYSNEGYDLPELRIHNHVVESKPLPGQLFATELTTLHDQRQNRRGTIDARVESLGEQIKASREAGVTPWVVWCNLNAESEAATAAYKQFGAVEITGSDHIDKKEENLIAFYQGKIDTLVSKPMICGHGCNWQHCHKQGFLGISHSFQDTIQAIGRSHRFGQLSEVDIHLVMSDADTAIFRNLNRKRHEHENMQAAMVNAMGEITKCELNRKPLMDRSYNPNQAMVLPQWLKSGW